MEPHLLTEPQLKCLASAPRQRVYQAVRSKHGVSATDIGSVLGMSSESVIFHLKQLVKVGLIEIIGSQQTGRRPGSTFAAIHQKIRIDPRTTPHDIIQKTTDATIRESHRQFRTASDLAAEDTSLQEELLILRTQFRLGPEARAKVKEMILEAMEFAAKNDDQDGQLMGFLALHYPIASR